MEDLLISALQNPGISPEQLLSKFPKRTARYKIRAALFYTFRRIALDEGLLPMGITLEDLALLFDQLIDLAQHQARRAETSQPKEARHV